jgi:hypothetical protein
MDKHTPGDTREAAEPPVGEDDCCDEALFLSGHQLDAMPEEDRAHCREGSSSVSDAEGGEVALADGLIGEG